MNAQELVALTDSVVSLIESLPTDTGELTVVPGSAFVEAAVGGVINVGVSAAFAVSDAALLNGSTPCVGVDIPFSSIVAKNNLPGACGRARGRSPARCCVCLSAAIYVGCVRAGQFIGGGYTAFGQPPRANPGRGLLCWSRRTASVIGAACDPQQEELPHAEHGHAHDTNGTRAARRRLPAADLAALSAAGFWPALASLLPPSLRQRLAAALTAVHTAPAATYLLDRGISPESMASAAALLGIDALTLDAFQGFTLSQPQPPLSLLVTSFVPLFDVELTVRLLLQRNQLGASIRVGPTFRVAGDGTITEGFLYQPQYTAFITQTVQLLAAAASGALRTTSAWLRGDAAAASSQAEQNAAALRDYFGDRIVDRLRDLDVAAVAMELAHVMEQS